MVGFTAGLAIGCLVGVSGTFLLILLATALSKERPNPMSELSPRGFAYPSMALLAVAGVSYPLKLDKDVVVLLFLMTVLVIAKMGGLANGLAASVVASGMLSFLFLPPVGSLMVARPDDQFALALFLLSAIFGSRLFGKAKILPEQHF